MASSKRRKFRKFTLYAFFTVVALMAVAMWLLPRIFHSEIEARIKARITEMTGGNYTVNMKELHVNLFTNTISAKEFEMKMDTNVFHQTGNALGVDLSVQDISFSG